MAEVCSTGVTAAGRARIPQAWAAGHAQIGRPCVQEEAFFKRYLEYCRTMCAPRLSQQAGEYLVNEYVAMRGKVGTKQACRHNTPGLTSSAAPETSCGVRMFLW